MMRAASACMLLAAALSALACAGWRGPARRPPPPALRLSQLGEEGDAVRRASLELVLEGLEADQQGDPERAASSYERAIQVDATNPWAFLALARQRSEGVDPESALPFLDQAAALLRAQGGVPPGAEAHLVGIRGVVLYETGRVDEGLVALRSARELAPRVWNDGRLSAGELR
jgi:tetratricopeptide (TPR) repeat protein